MQPYDIGVELRNVLTILSTDSRNIVLMKLGSEGMISGRADGAVLGCALVCLPDVVEEGIHGLLVELYSL